MGEVVDVEFRRAPFEYSNLTPRQVKQLKGELEKLTTMAEQLIDDIEKMKEKMK